MSDVVIKVENLYKQYRLGLVSTGTLTHDLNRWWHRVRGKEDPYQLVTGANNRAIKDDSEYVWALQNINFEVKRGEVLGIVGKNGAGKSTLLKILSKVTSPTKGDIKVKGRIASLLEVGTGFHPELTGRENIFLNGAILGMTKAEIRSKFDEIVDFSGVAKYVDTPVKRYSSGMYVRLAFAVAAHLEPEVLIVDEVLAVGDADFQKKCLGKMKDVSGQGRTVLFVSHNMAAVKSLCSKAILLQNGSLILNAYVDTTVQRYLKEDNLEQNHKVFVPPIVSKDVELLEIKINSSGKNPSDPIIEGEEIEFLTVLNVRNRPENYHVTYHLFNELGEVMFSLSHATESIPLLVGINNLICKFPGRFFNTGTYFLTYMLVEKKQYGLCVEKDIAAFTVINKQQEMGEWMGREPGFLKPGLYWENKP